MAKSSKEDQNKETTRDENGPSEKVENATPALTKEQKILNYIDGSKEGDVDLTPFLKSLYPLTTNNEPAMYHHQGESKRLRVMLQQMKNDGKITLKDENFQKLGTGYYTDDSTKTKYHTIDSVKIVAVK